MNQTKIAEYRKRYANAAALDKVPTTVILSAYNACMGKKVKGFHTRTKGIQQFLAALHGAKGKATATPAKPKAAKKAGAKKGGQGRTKYAGTSIIRVLVDENPKRPGTLAYDQFRVLMACDGKPVQTFLAQEGKSGKLDKRAGWPRIELAYCVRAELVELKKK